MTDPRGRYIYGTGAMGWEPDPGDPLYEPPLPPPLELSKVLASGNALAALLVEVGRSLGVARDGDLHARSASALASWEEVAGGAG